MTMENADKRFIELYKVFSFIVWSARSAFTKRVLLSIIEKLMPATLDSEAMLDAFVEDRLVAKTFLGKYRLSDTRYKYWLHLNDIVQQVNHFKIHKPTWMAEVKAMRK